MGHIVDTLHVKNMIQLNFMNNTSFSTLKNMCAPLASKEMN
jgi:hypothetical protein